MNAIGPMEANQAGTLAAMLLPAPGPGAAPAQPAFLNLVNLFIDPAEFAVAVPPIAPANTQASAGSNAAPAPALQTLSKSGAKRTVQPKQIAGALLRTMLGNTQPVMSQAPLPRAVAPQPQPAVPQTGPALAIPVSLIPVVTTPPPTRTPAVAPAVPSNPQPPVSVAPEPTPPATPPYELAFSVNLTPVNVPPVPSHLAPPSMPNSSPPTVTALASDPTAILPPAPPIKVVTQTPAPMRLSSQGNVPKPLTSELNPDGSRPQSNQQPSDPRLGTPIQPRAASRSNPPAPISENTMDSKPDPPPVRPT